MHYIEIPIEGRHRVGLLHPVRDMSQKLLGLKRIIVRSS